MAVEKTDPTEKTKRLLFGSASRCGFPDCLEPLVTRYGSLMAINAEVAHIRSAKPQGPRHISEYTPIHEFENLLLLCGKHHKLIDDHPDEFPIELLEGWKEIQIGEAGTALADDLVAALRQQVSALAETVAALSDSRLRRTTTVQLVAGRGSRADTVMVPLDDYRQTTSEPVLSIVYLGVEVSGQDALGVQQAGLEFEFGGGPPAVYLPPKIRRSGSGRETLLIGQEQLMASMIQLAKATRRLPQRFRGFAVLADGRQISSTWTSILELPIWRDEITENDLQRLMQRPPTRS